MCCLTLCLSFNPTNASICLLFTILWSKNIFLWYFSAAAYKGLHAKMQGAWHKSKKNFIMLMGQKPQMMQLSTCTCTCMQTANIHHLRCERYENKQKTERKARRTQKAHSCKCIAPAARSETLWVIIIFHSRIVAFASFCIKKKMNEHEWKSRQQQN